MSSVLLEWSFHSLSESVFPVILRSTLILVNCSSRLVFDISDLVSDVYVVVGLIVVL